jgi:hypothetical protein
MSDEAARDISYGWYPISIFEPANNAIRHNVIIMLAISALRFLGNQNNGINNHENDLRNRLSACQISIMYM